MNPPPVILASQSPRRMELLRTIIPAFHVAASEATEIHDATVGSRRLCEVNAQRKAMAVAERYPEHLVIGADTLVFLDREPLGKPADLAEARSTLGRLSGRTHEVVTGVCIIHFSGSKNVVFSDVTRVRFRELTSEVIDEYLRRVPVLDKAGSYAIQDNGPMIVEQVEGSMSNVIGLPLESLRTTLKRFGW